MAPQPELTRITIATFSEEKMFRFYSEVFKIDFEQKILPGAVLYEGEWRGKTLTLCPATLAQIHAEQNRHQMHVSVDDIDEFFISVRLHGGIIAEAIRQDGSGKTGSIADPDNNSIVVTQKL